MHRWVGPVLVMTMVGASTAAITAATAQDPALLARLPTGEWQLRPTGSPNGAISRLCVTRPVQLVQLHQSGASCTRVVLGETADSATVRYSCPTGTGRTTLTLGGAASVHIATQGLANGEPFDVDYDARLIGRCS